MTAQVLAFRKPRRKPVDRSYRLSEPMYRFLKLLERREREKDRGYLSGMGNVHTMGALARQGLIAVYDGPEFGLRDAPSGGLEQITITPEGRHAIRIHETGDPNAR